MRRPYHGWLVLAAGFVAMLIGYGMRNTFSVFYPVLVDNFGWTRGVTAIMYSITLLAYGFVAPIAGSLVDRHNPRAVVAAGVLIAGGGVSLCSLATETWHFYLLYGILVAIGVSLSGITPLSTVITGWFPHRRGFVFGLLGSGFGVSLVTAPVFQFLISTYGWQRAYIIIGLSAVAICVPLVLLFFRRSSANATQAAAATSSADAREIIQRTAVPAVTPGWDVKSALRTRTFKVFLIISFCNMGVAQQITLAHFVYILQDAGYAPMTAASLFSIFGVAFAVGTFSSFLSDRFGRTYIFLGGCLLTVLGTALMLATSAGTSLLIPLAFGISAGFGLGITPPTCFAAVADRFHGGNYGAIQGTIILWCSIGGAIGPWLGGILHDITGTYEIALLLVLLMAAIAGFAMWTVRPGKGDVAV